MDRQQAHDYAAYAQQQQQQQPPPQQQFGYPPQAQQFPGPPFGPPHPHLQQFPYHPHLQQQQQQQPPPQVLSHAPPPPPHPHHLPPPPSAFAPHLPPPLVAPQFHTAGAPPPAAAPLSDPELHKRIDKLVEYSAKNGPDFEAMIRDKQQDNPDYAFLFGGEGHAYYRYKLYASTRVGSFNPNPQFAPHMLPGMKGDEYFWRLQMFYIIHYKNHQMAMNAYMLSKIEKTEEKSLERHEKILDRHEQELDRHAKSMALMEKLQEQQKSIEQSHISNNQAFQRVAQTVEELERRTRRVGMNESAIRRW